MHTRICSKCHKQFETLNEKVEDAICYRCALSSISGNFPPEEGDFNSALIVSGEMTEQEARWLQEDLESVDHSREEIEWSRRSRDYDDEYDD